MEEVARTNDRPCYCVERRADKDERVGIRFSISERDGEMAPAPGEPRPRLLDSFFLQQPTKWDARMGFYRV